MYAVKKTERETAWGTRLCDNIAAAVETIKIGLTLILYEATPFADGHHISHNVHIHNGMVENAVHTCKQERNHPVKPLSSQH